MRTTGKLKKILLAGIIFLGTTLSFAQENNTTRPTIAVLSIDTKGLIYDPSTLTYMVGLELDKLKLYQIMDKYEMADVLKKNEINPGSCFAKSCVITAGKALRVDKVLTGSVERFGEKIVINLKLFDVQSGNMEKNDATEYLNLQPEIQNMIEISIKRLCGIQPEQHIVEMLINYDQPITSPKTSLKLNGPRMGASMSFGETMERLTAPKNEGGFDMFPVTSQFGWQQEFQYMSAGNFQALLESIVMIGGLENGRVIPSFTFLNGFRDAKSGWEIGIGPTFRIVQKADGFYDEEGLMGKPGAWHLQQEWNTNGPTDSLGAPQPFPSTYSIVSRLDSRGDAKLSTGLIIAVGKTFRSGYLNIPVNMYVSPRKDGWIVGASFGFNINKKSKIQ